VTLKAVLFDVDFTLAKPGPDLGPEGYQALGHRFGLELEPARYADARAAAVETVERHPELDHDEEVWVLFTERIIRGMGGDSERAYECALEMTRAWEHAENFELYEDTLPVLEVLRELGLKIGLVSNTGRDLETFVAHTMRSTSTRRSGRARTGRRSRIRLSSARRSTASASAPTRPRWSAIRRRTTSRAPARWGCRHSSSIARGASRRRSAACPTCGLSRLRSA
jgi:hypothetical protein